MLSSKISDSQDFDHHRRDEVGPGLPEHLDLLRCVPLTLRVAGLHRSDRLRLGSVAEGEVWPQGEKLPDRSSRTSRTAGFGSRRSRFVVTLSCSRSGLGLFQALGPVRREKTGF